MVEKKVVNIPLMTEGWEEDFHKGLEERKIERAAMLEKQKPIDLNREIKEQFVDLVKDKKLDDATELLVEHILSYKNIYTTKDDIKSEMWIYKEGIYIPQGKSEIKEVMRTVLGKWYNTWYYNQVINKIEADTFIEQEEFFRINHHNELPVKNGILNILTLELSPFTPKKIFFSKCPVEFDNTKQCPMIDAFLSDILANPEDKNVFYELGGFCLLKEYKFEKAFMFLGEGRNGKSKSLELIKKIIGPKSCYGLSLSSLREDNPNVSQLFGKMANISGDIGNKDLKEDGFFKRATGRDLLTVPRKFLNSISFVNFAKFIFACNQLPMVYDTSKGFWDRWVLLNFPYYFGTKEEIKDASEDKRKFMKLRNPNIINEITTDDELSGLLNQFLIGLKRLIGNNKFSSTLGCEEVKDTWIRNSNNFVSFCLENIEQSFDGKISKGELKRKYSDYCKKHKILPKSEIIIKKTLGNEFGASDERFTEQLGTQKWYWTGVKWK